MRYYTTRFPEPDGGEEYCRFRAKTIEEAKAKLQKLKPGGDYVNVNVNYCLYYIHFDKQAPTHVTTANGRIIKRKNFRDLMKHLKKKHFSIILNPFKNRETFFCGSYAQNYFGSWMVDEDLTNFYRSVSLTEVSGEAC